jgi:hypothetical protein
MNKIGGRVGCVYLLIKADWLGAGTGVLKNIRKRNFPKS